MDLIAKQVPKYLIIGDGRVARHFRHYFSLLQILFTVWSRKNPLELLAKLLKESSHVLILISDQAIDIFIAQYQHLTQAHLIHFSGSLISKYAHGTHPLMTFSENLYSLEEYLKISFVIDENCPDFKNILPGLSNRHFRLPVALKTKYHALCVLAGNFSCLLWKKLFYHFEKEFNLPESAAHPYLLQQTKNLIMNSTTALTGPLTRNDTATIEKNLAALSDDPFQELYANFLACYQQDEEVFK